MNHKFKEIGADFLLLLVAVAWGSTFLFVQDAVEQTPVYTFLFWRFFLVALLMTLISYKHLKFLIKKFLKQVVSLGFLCF